VRVVDLHGGLERAVDVTARVVKDGGVILYPTDTIYGIGCDATNKPAVERIITIKKREEDTHFIVLVHSLDVLKRLIGDVPKSVLKKVEKIIPAPVTFIFTSSQYAASSIPGCTNTIAVRVPDYEFCRRLCELCNGPVLSTSANIHGEQPGVNLATIAADVKQEVDLAIDGGELIGKPSTIVNVTGGTFRIVREGAYPRQALIEKLGREGSISIE